MGNVYQLFGRGIITGLLLIGVQNSYGVPGLAEFKHTVIDIVKEPGKTGSSIPVRFIEVSPNNANYLRLTYPVTDSSGKSELTFVEVPRAELYQARVIRYENENGMLRDSFGGEFEAKLSSRFFIDIGKQSPEVLMHFPSPHRDETVTNRLIPVRDFRPAPVISTVGAPSVQGYYVVQDGKQIPVAVLGAKNTPNESNGRPSHAIVVLLSELLNSRGMVTVMELPVDQIRRMPEGRRDVFWNSQAANAKPSTLPLRAAISSTTIHVNFPGQDSTGEIPRVQAISAELGRRFESHQASLAGPSIPNACRELMSRWLR